MNIQNNGAVPISKAEIQFNKNAFGLTQGVKGPLPLPPIEPGAQCNYALPASFGGPTHDAGTPLTLTLQMALGNSTGQIFFFQDVLPFWVLLSEDGAIPKQDYLALWKE